jgi:ABC-type transporter Mla subunit MlaD
MLVMNFFSGLEPWIRQYSYFLFGFFFLGLVALGIGSLTALLRLTLAGRGLKELSPADPINGATEDLHRALISMIESLSDRGGDWWGAVRPTVAQYARHDAAKGPQVGYFVTERAEESVLGAPSGGDGWLAFAHAVPGVLTSLGLLGTFVALLIGLHGLQKNGDGTWAIDPLVLNLSGKFVTSIVALTLSVVFVLLELMTRSALTRARHQLAHALSRVLPFLSTSHLLLDMQQESVRRSAALNELHKVSESQTSALMAIQRVGGEQSSVLRALHLVGERQVTQLERFNTDLAVSIGSAMDVRIVPALERLVQSTNDLQKIQSGLGEELLKEVGTKISGAVSGAAGEEMRSMSEAIKESVRSLNEAAHAMRDGQSKLVEVTSAVIGQMNESFGDNSKRLSDATEIAVRKVVEQIDGAAGGFSERIGGASQEVAAALLTTSTNLQRVVGECDRIVRNTEATVQRFDGLVTSVSAATSDIVSAHGALKTTAGPLQEVAVRTATLISSVERQVDAIGEAAGSLKATSITLKDVQDTLKSSWSEYERRFVDVDESLGNSLIQMKNGLDLYAEKIRDLNAGLDKYLSKALSDLSSVINELHESVDDLQTAVPARAGKR